MISIDMEFTIKNHPSLTMENKMKTRKGLDDRDSGKDVPNRVKSMSQFIL